MIPMNIQSMIWKTSYNYSNPTVNSFYRWLIIKINIAIVDQTLKYYSFF